ncbi:SGNH/GDSL hydrolase family protein [Haoranjiania flava]|uniref:SGNH/GDSL hydrolase family protein n=1 Tax=Haoranjiania flava TaxID=1856322 RepID=A0AAE3IPQ1_9BACT|nr:SGNH/GDSL hydrolase family protein [Haoranjiania flava]MCU7693557.1 SGNH/GDSL hydrolase family protein [Haoranjiania flava]
MKQIIFTVTSLLVFGILSAQDSNTDWANFAKYAEANKTVSPGTVVFLGNSITEGWANTHPQFFKQNNYTGRGIGGQTSSQMLVRFRADVINLKPKAVVILAGTNDIARNTGYIALENILGNIISMCEIAKANNVRAVLCSALPAYQFSWRKELQPAKDIITLNAMIKDYAQKNNITYVDYHSALKDERDGLPEKYAGDGVHPNSDAYLIMENLVQKALANKPPESTKKQKKERQYLFQRNNHKD